MSIDLAPRPVGPFHDEHLTISAVSLDQIEEGRKLAERNYKAVIIGRLERTGISSVQVMRPTILTTHEFQHQVMVDEDFREFIREALVDDANRYIEAQA
jgi:hypothetical protein